jgi:16S rRNA (guanine(966)-N(2))-methyltransferase RsmD
MPKRKGIRNGSFRQTTAIVRAAIFNILGNNLEGLRFVDLYAGSGTVGIEALKKGANEVIFVEKNPLRCKTVKKLLRESGLEGKARLYCMDAFQFILKMKKKEEKADVVFLDPPYQSEEIMKILPLFDRGILTEDSTVIVEHFYKRSLPEKVGELSLRKRYSYGDTALSIYKISP